MSEWVMLIPLMVFTKIKQDLSQEVKDAYNMSDKNFSTTGTNTEAVFPFVYLSGLPSSEVGQDLTGNTLNGGRIAFQVDVTDSQSQTRARKVMTDIMRIMKEMGFEVNAIPNFQTTPDNTHRMTARFRRVFGANDII